MNVLKWLFPEPPAVLKTMPAHVDAVKLDMDLLFLSMDRARNINPAVRVGFIKPQRDEPNGEH